MSKKRDHDSDDFNMLRSIGFEFESPQDEFSYQPDSGGRPNGKAGKQESGVDITLDASPSGRNSAARVSTADRMSEPKSSDPYQHMAESISDIDDENLVEGVYDRLSSHPTLKQLGIEVYAQEGVVTLRGEVPTESMRQNSGEIVEALPGIVHVRNYLNVSRRPY